MQLSYLAYAGKELPAARVDFVSSLNLIYGASDTGKSFICDSVDFMFGGDAPRDIPESRSYQHVLLGIQLDDGRQVTLVRPRGSRTKRIDLYEGHFDQRPGRPPDISLSPKHDSKSEDNISRVLLQSLGV